METLAIREFVKEHIRETEELLCRLAAIPAPSYHEQEKASFILGWLRENGADTAYIDSVGNVIFPYQCGEGRKLHVFMAHTDVVFPDTEPFQIREENGVIYCPGIKDDNADLATLLMCIKYVVSEQPDFRDHGILFAANVCEEGLGNLLGSRQILKDFGDRIEQVVSFDGNFDEIVNVAVGSVRYRITVRTEGGHSYNAFGSANAIYQISQIIQRLYQTELPTKAKTTYNVGVIEGGTSVNTIAQNASILYEFRSEDEECLEFMEKNLQSVIDEYANAGFDVAVEVIGKRPCASKELSKEKMNALTDRYRNVISRFTDMDITESPGSTDANTFVSAGIPSLTIGTSYGGKTHTREEWLRKDCIETGLLIGLSAVMLP